MEELLRLATLTGYKQKAVIGHSRVHPAVSEVLPTRLQLLGRIADRAARQAGQGLGERVSGAGQLGHTAGYKTRKSKVFQVRPAVPDVLPDRPQLLDWTLSAVIGKGL